MLCLCLYQLVSVADLQILDDLLDILGAFLGAEDVYKRQDLNLLKTTNDTYGHAGGDVLLQSAAKCMTAVYDKVYRVGGDEFIALLLSLIHI